MFYKRRQICQVCERNITLDYKKPEELKQYMNRLGKILPKRATRLCTNTNGMRHCKSTVPVNSRSCPTSVNRG